MGGNTVNFVSLSGSIASSAVSVNALGTDTDISVLVSPKGAGSVIAGSSTDYLSFSSASDTSRISAVGPGFDAGIVMSGKNSGNITFNVVSNGNNGNVGIGVGSFNSVSRSTLSILNGTAPDSSVADTIQLYSSDLTAGNTTLALWTEGTNVSSTVSAVPTENIAIKVNGTIYYLMAKTIV